MPVDCHPPEDQETMLMTAPMLTPKDFEFPAIMLSGVVDHGMYLHFKNCLSTAPQQGLVVVEISTLGGDPEIALPRQDRGLFRRRHLHELLRHRKPLSDARHPADDP